MQDLVACKNLPLHVATRRNVQPIQRVLLMLVATLALFAAGAQVCCPRPLHE